MADQKPAAGTAKTPATNAPLPVKPAAAEKPAKKERVAYKEVFDTAEAATAEAEARTKGPRRAFTCEANGKTFYVVANNEGRAGGVAFLQLGGKVAEIGKKAKSKSITADTVLQSLSAMPEAERQAIIDAIAKMPKSK
jgi:hypothetical protein